MKMDAIANGVRPHLEKSSAGSIVVIGTIAAIEIAGAPRPYASVKAALAPYVKALARNLAAKDGPGATTS